MSATCRLHCLSFDVEEHFQVSAFWSDAMRRQWDDYESRVERNTRKIAEMLARHETKATFFVLGWVAERHPNLVKTLASEGHEIASHGYGHERVTNQSPDGFRDDVRRSKGILEDLTGNAVIGYRAPSFSISNHSWWALSILIEEGYRYDSSMYDRFSLSSSKNRQEAFSKIETPSGTIWEIPPTTTSFFGLEIPVAGGGYFRLFPYPVLKRFLRQIEKAGLPLVMYLHPWEIDVDQPRMKGPLISRLRHYVNLDKTERRLIRLLHDFSFAPIREAITPIAEISEDRFQSLLIRNSLASKETLQSL